MNAEVSFSSGSTSVVFCCRCGATLKDASMTVVARITPKRCAATLIYAPLLTLLPTSTGWMFWIPLL